MHRFYLTPNQCAGATLVLHGHEAHHALHVLRIQRGEQVIVLDGAGGEYTCRVEERGRDELRLSVTEKKTIPPLACAITLLQAVPKGKHFEDIVQKATELGVSRIVPLLSERVTIRLDAVDAEKKAEKWQHVAIEAIKQCGAAWLPKMERLISPKEFLARGETFDLPLIASLQPGAQHPRNYFRQFESQHGRKPKSACVWIGPEGDFTPDEVTAITSAGAKPMTLGKLVLRVETAAIYCLSILNYEAGIGAGLED